MWASQVVVHEDVIEARAALRLDPRQLFLARRHPDRQAFLGLCAAAPEPPLQLLTLKT